MKVLLVLVGLAAAARLEANPIRRIVTLLQNMQKEVQEEGRKEKDLYDKFMCYCSGNTDNIAKDISGNSDASEQLAADVKAKTARKAQLDSELEDHKSDRADAKAAINKATKIRETENKQYVSESGDQSSYIEALKKGIEAISKGMGASLLQTPHAVDHIQRALEQSQSVTESEKQSVLSFLSAKSPYGDYSGASGEIVGILKQMLDDINKDLGGIVSEEESAQKAFEDLVGAKKAEIAAASDAIEKKSVRSGELAVGITQDKNAKDNAEREMSTNQKFLANLKTDCATKSDEQDARVKARNDEILAISEAIKVLNDDDSLEIFKNTLPSPNSFLQRTASSSVVAEAYSWLQIAASGSNDRHTQLGLLAYMLRVGKVDFNKILKMIDDMVAHLINEQKNDEKERTWCDDEFEETDDKKNHLQRRIHDLTTQIDEDEDTSTQHKSDIESLTNKISELDESVTSATKLRKDENAEFVQTLAELTAAKQLLEKAKNRLNKFYNPKLYKAPPPSEMTEEERIYSNFGGEVPTEAPQLIAGTNIAVNLLQVSASAPEEAPATWSAGGYKKKAGKSSGVIGLMDMMIKDVDTQMQEGKHDEKTAQVNYEGMMADSTATRSTDAQSLADQKKNLADTEMHKADSQTDRRSGNKELSQTNQYNSELHAKCDFLVQNFQIRKEARSQEKNALTNAKAVLSGANYA